MRDYILMKHNKLCRYKCLILLCQLAFLWKAKAFRYNFISVKSCCSGSLQASINGNRSLIDKVILIIVLWSCLISVSVAYSEDTVTFGEKMFHSGEYSKAREAFEKVLRQNNRDAQAHYFLGLIEYEEGNIEKAKTRFQIAHECLSSFENGKLIADDKHVQLEFPDNYKVRVYYKDGWYVVPKDPAVINSNIHSLESGSSYRIKLEPSSGKSLIAKSVVVSFIALSFFLAR